MAVLLKKQRAEPVSLMIGAKSRRTKDEQIRKQMEKNFGNNHGNVIIGKWYGRFSASGFGTGSTRKQGIAGSDKERTGGACNMGNIRHGDRYFCAWNKWTGEIERGEPY